MTARARAWHRAAARLRPRTVRTRLTLLYAGLFLLAGAVLLAVTYGLVANSLPGAPKVAVPTPQELAGQEVACKAANGGAGKLPAPRAKSSACEKIFAEGAAAAATDQRDRTLHDLLVFSLLGLAGMTLVSGAVGWAMAGRALRPVRAITGAARRASQRHLGERLALRGPRDELRELADTFDEMLDRLDAAFASQQRFVADASHELRTPLAVMRTALDVTLAKPAPAPEQLEAMAAKVRRSIDRAEALVEALLTLATSEQDLRRSERVDLATLAEDALDDMAADVARLGLRVEARLEPAETVGDPVLLERLVANVVENAARHNEPGGYLRVRTASSPAGACIEVENSGPVVPEEVVPELFEPFRRVDERTGSGVGLGLAIVRSVATAHGARLEARSRPAGGLAVSVSVPAPPAAEAVS